MDGHQVKPTPDMPRIRDILKRISEEDVAWNQSTFGLQGIFAEAMRDGVIPHTRGPMERIIREQCGTSRCVAGWAVTLYATDRQIRRLYLLENQSDREEPALGHAAELARDLLGLTDREAQQLFYDTVETEDGGGPVREQQLANVYTVCRDVAERAGEEL